MIVAPKLTWFGDDFTGAAAVMEVLAFAGIDTILFADMPDPALMERFAGCDAIGIASTARTEGPEWMDANLPAAFAFLKATGAPILHYKVCSTFDSSPSTGSIGRATEIGLRVMGAKAALMVTAAPQMRRYQAFGNLFAGTFDGVFRLDRHPVMSQHPVTPMAEADLLTHLSAQTDLRSGLIDLEALWSDPAPRLAALLEDGARVISIDSMEERSEAAAGKLIWDNRDEMSFVVGSQGIEFALVRHWLNEGIIPPPAPLTSAGKVDQIAVVSGSVSPSTAQQIDWAAANGFEVIRFDAAAMVERPAETENLIAKAVMQSLAAISNGQSPLVCSATGPRDPAVAAVREASAKTGTSMDDINRNIGITLGRILDEVLRKSDIRRAVISGGDTSGHGMRALGLKAIKAIAPTIPGASLCTGYGGEHHDGLEIALKGGQMGSMDFFGWIRDGGGPR
ncbi:four-carbon acid sugar kinase family protein [Marivivens donghaensis]|uniref:Four-carbon acid sugar kinase family protein n=1 Tax=Marivivens donghaensis TaxID=1699413 RepID=A0ABX0VVI9_9RHOB|nr:four-carbon acid sugar kinase family protein [Marivivens donghaensis]